MSGPPPIRDVLRDAWQRYADRPALIVEDHATSFAELGERAGQLAAAFRKLGTTPGSAVGCVLTPDALIQMEIRLATYELGATLFAVPPDLLDYGHQLFRRVDPTVVVYDPRLVPGIPEWLRHVCPGAHAIPARGSSGDYGGLLATTRSPAPNIEYNPETLTAVGFTSGTTGPPKGITATQGAAAWSCWMMQRVFAGDQRMHDGGVLVGIPLFAAGGGMILPTLAAGGTIIAPPVFDPVDALERMDRGEVVTAFLSPSMIIDLLDAPDLERYDLSGVRTIIYGTSIMPVPKIREAISRIGPIFLGGYGMAEVLPPVTVLYPDEHGTRSTPADNSALSSVGRPVEGVQVRIVDVSGRSVPADRVGEVEIRSPAVTTGYWGDEDRTAASRNGGWWRSGDVGFLDREHRLHILSRRADILWFDGTPVYPRQLEEACGLHPAVKEACAVQPEPDKPAVVAVSLRSPFRTGNEGGRINGELRDLLDRHVGDSAIIDDIMVFDEIPRSVQGKVLHREVRAAVRSHGGAGVA
jgi:fatty-acyl-CoA synthase